MADGVRISSWSGLRAAEAKLDEIAASGKYKNRKCLSCPVVFLSEGAHHRMCDQHRRQSSGSFELAL